MTNPYAQPPGYGHPQPGPFDAPPMVPAYAGWGSRVAAALLDGLIGGLVPMAMAGAGAALAVGSAVGSCDAPPNGGCSSTGAGGVVLGFVLMVAASVIGLAIGLWLCYREGTTGQTPGKRVVGIRLVREADGQPIGFGLAFVRRLCHILDGLACDLGYLWPLWDAKRQTFADKIMATVVIRSQ